MHGLLIAGSYQRHRYFDFDMLQFAYRRSPQYSDGDMNLGRQVSLISKMGINKVDLTSNGQGLH